MDALVCQERPRCKARSYSKVANRLRKQPWSNAARLLSIGTALELLVCSLGGHAAGAGTGLEILVATTEGIVKRTHANGATHFYNNSQPRCSSKSST